MLDKIKVELIVPRKALAPLHRFVSWVQTCKTGRLTFHFHRGTVGAIETDSEGVRATTRRRALDVWTG